MKWLVAGLIITFVIIFCTVATIIVRQLLEEIEKNTKY